MMGRAGVGLGHAASRLRSMSPRDRRALLLGFVIVAPVVAWMGIVRPWWNGLGELRAATAMEQDLLTRERQLLMEAPALPGRLAEARIALARKASLLVQSSNLTLAEATVTEVVQERARESSALLLEARSTPPDPTLEAPTGLVPIRLNVRVESDFEGILEFLNRLEAGPLVLRVISFSMEVGEEDAMTLTATLEAYAPTEEMGAEHDPPEAERPSVPGGGVT